MIHIVNQGKAASVRALCKSLGVGYWRYYHMLKKLNRKKDVTGRVLELVRGVRARMPHVGVRKLHLMLAEPLKELHVGRDKLFHILADAGMLVQKQKSYIKTTRRDHNLATCEDKYSQANLTAPEQCFVADMTYLKPSRKTFYLSLVMDAYSHRIMGYDVSISMETPTTLRALEMAHSNRLYPDRPLVHHSDRGAQYCSAAYRAALERLHMTPSNTQSHDPYTNAQAERLNGILKQEFDLEARGRTLAQMRAAVALAVKTYNEFRPHLACGMRTPCAMHAIPNGVGDRRRYGSRPAGDAVTQPPQGGCVTASPNNTDGMAS